MKRNLCFICLLLLMIPLTLLTAASKPKDLLASLAQLPGLADTPDKGAFVEVVKAMDEVYPGKIIISLYPFARSINNVISGTADFHIPAMRNPLIQDSTLKYKYVTENIGTLAQVLYSHKDKPLTKKDIMDAVAKGGQFSYNIEVSGGAEGNCPFPVIGSNDWDSSFRKLASKRIDAIWNAQEETDLVLKKLKLKSIHREFWGNFVDVIVISKDARGDEMDKILSDLLKKLRQSGKLETIYRKVHMPYDDWQPINMNW